MPLILPYSPDDPEDIKLAKLLLDAYHKTLNEVRKNQEYIEWYNNLSLIKKAAHQTFLNCVSPSPEQIIANYEEICDKALEIVKDPKNRNAILKKKRWFDEKKEKFFKLKEENEPSATTV